MLRQLLTLVTATALATAGLGAEAKAQSTDYYAVGPCYNYTANRPGTYLYGKCKPMRLSYRPKGTSDYDRYMHLAVTAVTRNTNLRPDR